MPGNREAVHQAYTESASTYDLLYVGTGLKDYATEADEVDHLIRSRNPGAATLLDVGCGTGQHLACLRGRYAVEGVDVSPEMLAVARARLPDVPLHVSDMRRLDLGREFDAVTCLFSSIGYATDDAELHQTVAGLARHLAPGGVLIIDGWIRPDAWQDRHRPAVEQADDGETLVVRVGRSWREGNLTTLEMHHLVCTEGGIRHFSERHLLALVPTDVYVAAVQRAGLGAEVERDYMPGRDRVIGVRPR
jgi:SAM-dependent methyltransferase